MTTLKSAGRILTAIVLVAVGARADELEQRFQQPLKAARPHVMWMWMGCDIAVIALPAQGVAAKGRVIDLTGKTEWEVPPGEWTIDRFRYTTKGTLLQPPQWGGPTNPVTFEKLEDWTQRTEPGIKYYSGPAIYRKTFDSPHPTNLLLDLGVVNHTAKVRLNGRDLGVVWTAPWQVKISDGLLRERDNQLEIEVANVWANRLIGDEQEPPDCEWIPGARGNGGSLKEFPDWFLKNEPRPSSGRYCVTTWNYFTKDSPLIPSGLLGTVRLMR